MHTWHWNRRWAPGKTLPTNEITPGHAPDAICLWDSKAKYLWTGDSFYQGPIFLFDASTNLQDYYKSILLIARYAASAGKLLPTHNIPGIAPEEVIAAAGDSRKL